LPFFRRFEGVGAGGAGKVSVDTFCRLLRLDEGGFACSISGRGLASRAGAFRFRDEVGRVERSGDGSVSADPPDEGSEDPACLADARVTREEFGKGNDLGRSCSCSVRLSKALDDRDFLCSAICLETRHDTLMHSVRRSEESK